MRITVNVFSMVFLGLTVSSSPAAVFVPGGLNPGDEYHLVFVTDGAIDATSSDINVYNDFVQAEAEVNPTLTGTGIGVTYAALTSTLSLSGRVNARDNALIEAPVYLVDGTLIATGFSDMWDGSIASPINTTQTLTVLSGLGTLVWTGSNDDGTSDSEGGLGNLLGIATHGEATLTSSEWVDRGDVLPFGSLPIYGLSSKLTVPAVPEPSSLVLLAGLGLAGACRRR